MRWRKTFFRLAAFALPFCFLALVEACLRVAGYGFPTGFFLERNLGAEQRLTDNAKFGWRFFPPAMARTPRPFSISASKPPDTYRIFVLGESAAWGDPEPAVGFARMIEVMLRERYPGTRLEVVNVAMTAINSHAIVSIAGDCAKREGDLWLIYMGHNEVVGPFGAGTVFGAQTPGLPMIRSTLALKTTRIGQWLDARRLRWEETPVKSWAGMTMFLDKQVASDDARLQRVYRHFERNLREVLQAGRRAGVQQIVCTVGSNLKDCAPFASQAGAAGSNATEAARFYATGTAAESAGDLAGAIEAYEKAARVDSSFAELHFRHGRCLSALGRHGEARASYAKARDLDTLRFRADSTINRIVRKNAESRGSEGIHFLDAAELLATNSANQIPGEEFFYEHVHLTFSGNYLVARAAAERISQLLPPHIARKAVTSGWLSLEECARRLGWTDWNRRHVLEDIRRRLLDPPFTNQLGHAERLARLERQLAELSATPRVEQLHEAARQYRASLAYAPEDWVLHEKLAEVLRDLRDAPGAIEHWQHVLRLLPHHAGTHNNLGNLYRAIGNVAQAEKHFHAALDLHPELPDALNGLGLLRAAQQQFPAAIDCYQRALRAKSDFVAAHVNLGLLFASQGKTAEAKEHYKKALALRPDNGAAHANLAKLLAEQGNLAEATRHFTAAVRFMPDNAAAHLNLGHALVAQNQEAAAVDTYAAAARLDPRSADARVNLGTLLVRQGKFVEAITPLTEAIQLNPNSAAAHLSLGVALRQQGKTAEAKTHFREALRIEPTNAQARKHLDAPEGEVPARP